MKFKKGDRVIMAVPGFGDCLGTVVEVEEDGDYLVFPYTVALDNNPNGSSDPWCAREEELTAI